MAPKAKGKARPVLDLETGRKLQDELIKAYEDEAFQNKLRAAWRAAGDDKLKQMQARQDELLKVQLPVITKYGFDGSRKGSNDSKLAFGTPVFQVADIQEKFNYTMYLLDPDLQALGPYVSKLKSAEKQSAPAAASGGYPESDQKAAFQKDLDRVLDNPEKPAAFLKGLDIKGAADPALRAEGAAKKKEKFQPFIPMSRETAIALQTDLIAGFSKEDFRIRMLQAWKAHEMSSEKARKWQVQLVCLEVQVPIMIKYGFEGSYVGVLSSLQSMSAENLVYDEQIAWNSAYMLWLINPAEQAKRAERKTSKLDLVSEDLSPLCTLDFDFTATFRYAKERIQQVTGIAWQAQQLKLETPPETEETPAQSALTASPLSTYIGELHDWELVTSTVPIGRSARIILIQRNDEDVRLLKTLCPVASKRNAKTSSSKAMHDAVTQAVAKVPAEALCDLSFLIPAVQLSTAALKAVLKAAPAEVRANKIAISAAIGLSGQALQFASDELQDDRELVTAAVDSDGFCLQFASSRLQADREVVVAALDNDGWALQYASEDLQKDVELAGQAVQRAGWVITSLAPELQTNVDVVGKAVRQDPNVLEDLPSSMKSSKEVVMMAVTKNGNVLQHADEDLQGDSEVVKAAARNCGSSVRFASTSLKSNRDVGLTAVRQDGMTLPLLGWALQEDIDVVVAAVRQNFGAMKFVKGHLKPQVCAALDIDLATANEYSNENTARLKAAANAQAQAAAAEKARQDDLKVHLDALGLSESTLDSKTITRQYRRLALIHHPDKNPDDTEGAKNRMAAINHAYQCLCQILDLN
mmetsp:Transcript_147534/g.269010  ORF Transcript_147534/g.269010 Transcript_147534/m.269010 type:complete len:810 (-) Transcript_147534:82-2511(-)